MAQDFLAQFKAGMADSDKKIKDRAQYGAAVAEALGHYTPELEQMVTGPLGYNPTVGENLLSAPIRGLGKLFGNESMQQVGQPRAFPLPEAQPTPTDPILEAFGKKLGINVPSEQKATGRLKTGYERQQALEDKKQYMQLYQWMAEQQMKEQKFEQDKLTAIQSRAESVTRMAEMQDRIDNPKVTEAQLMAEHMEKYPNDTYKTLKAFFASASARPSSQMQLVNAVAKELDINKTKAFEWIEVTKANPEQLALRAANESMTFRDWSADNFQEILDKKVRSNYDAIVNLKQKLSPSEKEELKEPLPKNFPYSAQEVRSYMADENIQSWNKAIEEMSTLDKEMGPLNVNPGNEPKPKPKSKPK